MGESKTGTEDKKKHFRIENNSVVVTVDKRIYSKEDILVVAQRFSDSCWVEVEGDNKNDQNNSPERDINTNTNTNINIKITPKTPLESEESLEMLGRRFMNHVFLYLKE